MMYDPKSLKAEEFICHDEVMDSLAYADENKDNMEVVRQILDKAALRKGISHREASVLLACEDEEITKEICTLAEQIKKDFYEMCIRDRKALIADDSRETAACLAFRADQVREQIYGRKIFIRGLIEFTNYCKNDCYYCGIRRGNNTVSRYRLSEEQILDCCKTVSYTHLDVYKRQHTFRSPLFLYNHLTGLHRFQCRLMAFRCDACAESAVYRHHGFRKCRF